MKSPLHLALAAATMLVFAPGCSVLRPGDEGEETDRVSFEEKKVYLGEVSIVSESGDFVLIKTPVRQRLKAGIPLESYNGDQRTGELLFSPEQTHGYMTADITSGAPQIGDLVFLYDPGSFGREDSPRLKHAVEQHEREQNMSFWDRRKAAREQKKRAKKKRQAREATEREDAYDGEERRENFERNTSDGWFDD